MLDFRYRTPDFANSITKHDRLHPTAAFPLQVGVLIQPSDPQSEIRIHGLIRKIAWSAGAVLTNLRKDHGMMYILLPLFLYRPEKQSCQDSPTTDRHTRATLNKIRLERDHDCVLSRYDKMTITVSLDHRV
jgi:hypothetical protein